MTLARSCVRRFSLLVLLALAAVGATGATATTTTHPAPAAALESSLGAPTPVYRYWSRSAGDWVSSPAGGNQPSPAQWSAAGYVQFPTPQFSVDLVGIPGMVAVYRWWQPSDQDWVDIVDNGSMPDLSLEAAGYTQKTFQWYAYPTRQTADMVAVYRWWQPTDRDWVTLGQGEISDATLVADGYTKKTFLFYAHPYSSSSGQTGYFPLGPVQSKVLQPMSWSTDPSHPGLVQSPHTFSVVDVNAAMDSKVNEGYRYLGYYGHVYCAGIGIARSNDLVNWVQDPNPLFQGDGERWASVLVDDSAKRIDMVHNVNYCSTTQTYSIVGRHSTDIDGTSFSDPVTLVSEPGNENGNPTLFKDPIGGRVYLYWFRQNGGVDEIRVKSAATFDDLLNNADPSDVGDLLAMSPMTVAAPQVMEVGGTYYLSVETKENDLWRTRVLTASSPTGPFAEVPGNPLYGDGAACVFQQVFDGVMHSYYCQQATPNDDTSWTLDQVTANVSSSPAISRSARR